MPTMTQAYKDARIQAFGSLDTSGTEIPPATGSAFSTDVSSTGPRALSSIVPSGKEVALSADILEEMAASSRAELSLVDANCIISTDMFTSCACVRAWVRVVGQDKEDSERGREVII
jgi:hypothetical protein